MGLAMPGDVLFVTNGKKLLASSGWRPVPPKRIILPQMSKILKLRNPRGKASPNYKLKTAIYKVVITKKKKKQISKKKF